MIPQLVDRPLQYNCLSSLQLEAPLFSALVELNFATHHLLLHLEVQGLSLRLDELHIKGTYSGCSEVTCRS